MRCQHSCSTFTTYSIKLICGIYFRLIVYQSYHKKDRHKYVRLYYGFIAKGAICHLAFDSLADTYVYKMVDGAKHLVE